MSRQGRKASVVEAAVTLFSRKGYHGTSVRDIAVESGMQSGSLYAHISSKEDLLFEIVLRAAEQFMAALQPIAAGPGTAAEKLRLAMAAHLQVVAGALEGATVFLHEWKALSGERRAMIAEQRNRYERLLSDIICEGIESGEFRRIDEKFARLLLLSAVNWLHEWYDPAGPLGPAEVAERFSDLLLDGFRSKGGVPS